MSTNVEGLELVETDAGRELTYSARRSGKRTVVVDRRWDVVASGRMVGSVRYVMITRETRSKGRMYVNTRWSSPGWQYQTAGGAHWFEGYSRKYCVERLIRDAD